MTTEPKRRTAKSKARVKSRQEPEQQGDELTLTMYKGDQVQYILKTPPPLTVDLERKDETVQTVEIQTSDYEFRMFNWYRRRVVMLSLEVSVSNNEVEAGTLNRQIIDYERKMLECVAPSLTADDIKTFKDGWEAPLLVAIAKVFQPGYFGLVLVDAGTEA